MDERSSLGTVSKRRCVPWNARARHVHVEATSSHPERKSRPGYRFEYAWPALDVAAYFGDGDAYDVLPGGMTPTYKARAGCLHDLLDAGETAGGADVFHDNLLTHRNDVGDPSSLSCLDLFAVNNVVHRALFSRLAACVACRGDLCNGAARGAADPSWYSNAFMVDSVALASSADLHKEDERVSFVDLGTSTCDAATSSDGICHKAAHALGCGYDGGDCCGVSGFGCAAPWLRGGDDDESWRYAVTTARNPRTLAGQALEEHAPVSLAYGADGVPRGAGPTLANFKGAPSFSRSCSQSFRLRSRRAIIARSGLDARMLFPERARAERSR